MKTLINVTAEHIARGRKEHCYNCPIALAITQAITLKAIPKVYSFKITFFFVDELDITEIYLPDNAQKFIELFDCGQTVNPFSFELDIPDCFLRKAS